MQLIQDCGVENNEMYKTFNMGVGFCVILPKNDVVKTRNIFKKHRLTSYEIGKITSKKGSFRKFQKNCIICLPNLKYIFTKYCHIWEKFHNY